jgi:hypothetical protein
MGRGKGDLEMVVKEEVVMAAKGKKVAEEQIAKRRSERR